MRPRTAVIDHGAGNLVSISQALKRAGAEPVIVQSPSSLASVDAIVLPGVGAASSVMAGISDGGFTETIRTWEGPLLGICVGMQVLFDGSDEDDAICLGLIPGRVRSLAQAPRLPHIGWNDVEVSEDQLFDGLDPAPDFYFVHSYAADPTDPALSIAFTSYPDPFCAAVRSGRRVGTQFHPERSGRNGLIVLSNFVKECA